MLKTTMSKLNADNKDIQDNQIRLKMILDHATFAKNSMMDSNGYSPFLRTFGPYFVA